MSVWASRYLGIHRTYPSLPLSSKDKDHIVFQTKLIDELTRYQQVQKCAIPARSHDPVCFGWEAHIGARRYEQ